MDDKKPAPVVAENSPRSSKTKLTIFFILFFAFTAVMIGLGISRRDKTLALGGPMIVTVKNISAERLRVDLFVGPQLATVELDAGENEVVRFSLRKTENLEVNLYQYGKEMATDSAKNFEPAKDYNVTVVLKSKSEFTIETSPVATR